MIKWLIAEAREPVVALVQLAVSAAALEVARRARRRAKRLDDRLQAVEADPKLSASSSNSPSEAPTFLDRW